MPRPLAQQLLRHAHAELRQLRRVGGAHRRTARRIARAQALAAFAVLLAASAQRAEAQSPRFLNPSFPFGLVAVGLAPRPAFGDLDGDGDLDLLVGSYAGTLSFFENDGVVHVPDFAAPSATPFGLADVGDFPTPALGDLDGDGDLDALVGNSDGELIYFENTGSAGAPAFGAPSTTFPSGIGSVGSFSSPAFADIDGDGDLDVFVGSYDGYTFFYENSGNASAPAFLFGVADPFGLTDRGLVAAPAFVDLDGDGDLDAMIGQYFGTVVFSENVGTPSAPLFSGDDGNPFGLENVGSLAGPAFADLDADGDFDTLIGNGGGGLIYFRNTGTRSAPAFRAASSAFGVPSVLFGDAPELGDLDGDGDLDVLVGSHDGLLVYAPNTGTRSTPAFGSSESQPFGLAAGSAFSTPALADLDGDGDLDLLVGDDTGGGTLRFFSNTGSAAAPAFGPVETNPFCAGSLGSLPAPAFADFGADGDLDLAIGYGDGRLDFCENTGSAALPAFASAETNPFGLSGLGVGAAPAFGDLENDGDLDALLGEATGAVIAALNSQSTASPFFVPFPPLSFGLGDVGSNGSPALADVDGDGDLDAFAGGDLGAPGSGSTTFFENLAVTLLCASAPRPDCDELGGSLAVDERKPGKEKLALKLQGGPGLVQTDFGDPLAAGGTAFGVCVYDGDGARVASLDVLRAGELCGAKPCWKPVGGEPPDGKGFAYKDKAAGAAGVTALSLKAGGPGKSKLEAAASNHASKGRSALPAGIAAALADSASVTIQVQATGGACFSAALVEIKKQEPDLFKAK